MKQYPKYKDSKIPWIGDVPEHWEVLRLKGIAQSFFKGSGITREDVFEDGDTPCVRYGDIYTKYNISFSQCLTKTNKERLASCVYMHHGDIAFTLTGELVEEIGKSIVYLGFEKCLVGGDIAILRHSQNPSFLGYYLSSSVAQQQKSFGKSKLKVVHTKIGDLKNVVVSLPPADEQQAIVDFLDKAVKKIDRYIAAKEAEIEKLGTLKQSIISQAVTKGLDPNAPMKDSGIPWIGDVPEHWGRLRYKDILVPKDIRVGNNPSYTLLSLTKQGVIVRDLSEGKGKFPKDFDTYKVVESDDFILCLFDVDETPRTVGVANNYGMITGAYDIFSVRRCQLRYLYYHYLSLDDKKCLKPLYKGLRKTIPLPRLLSAYIYLPSDDEQQVIVKYIDEQVQKIETSISNIRQQIEKLKTYKQRLISDAVTGKIDVRNTERKA